MEIQKQIYCRKPTLDEMEQLFTMGTTHVAWGVDPSAAAELEVSRQIVTSARRAGIGTVVLVYEPRVGALESVALDVAPDFLLVAAEHIGNGIEEHAGRTNDWDVCATIVRRVRCRVMLAGGLGPHNVAEAILKVRPWGVDACSALERLDRSKDLDACASFLRAVDAAVS